MNLPQWVRKNTMVFFLQNMCIMGNINGTNKFCYTKNLIKGFDFKYMGALVELFVFYLLLLQLLACHVGD